MSNYKENARQIDKTHGMNSKAINETTPRLKEKAKNNERGELILGYYFILMSTLYNQKYYIIVN